MKVSKDKVVTLTYELHLNNAEGEVIQTVDETKPFAHLFGVGTLLPAFEENLAGLEPGDTFSFSLAAGDAYGNKTDEAIIELDKKMFEIEGKIDDGILTVGNVLAMQDQDGNPIDGRVLEVKEDKVIMDFNHPLAGQDLYFTGKILDVRDATEEEITHKHVHGEGGHKH